MFNRLQVEYQSLSASSSDLNLLPFVSKTFFPFCLRQQLFFKQFYSFCQLFGLLSLFTILLLLCRPSEIFYHLHPILPVVAQAYLDFISWLFLCDNEFLSPPSIRLSLILLARFYTMFSFLLCKAEKKSDCERMSEKKKFPLLMLMCRGEFKSSSATVRVVIRWMSP